MGSASVAVRPTHDGGNEVPRWEEPGREVRGLTVCMASASFNASSCGRTSNRDIDGPGEGVEATIGDTTSSAAGGPGEPLATASGTAVQVEAIGVLDWSGSGRQSRFDC